MELHDINPDKLLGDKGYDSDDIRDDLAERGIEPVIPPRSNRKTPIEYDRQAYKRRNLIERCVSSSSAASQPVTRKPPEFTFDAMSRGSKTLDQNCQHGLMQFSHFCVSARRSASLSRKFRIHPALIGIFFAVDRRNVRRIFIEIGSPDPIFLAVRVDPLPQDFA
jgi:IS5 family transposase